MNNSCINYIDDNNNAECKKDYNFDKYSSILKDINSKIDQITKGSESDFLKIGNQLANYLHGTKDLYDTSVLAATSISEQILQKGITPLSVLMHEFSGYLTNSSLEIGNDINSLEEIYKNIVVIIDEQSGFTKIVKQLKMLGISTKIESVRFGTDEQGFYNLAENVDKLSGLISEKSKTISVKSVLLNNTISSAIENLKKLSARQREHSESILKHTTHSIAGLKSKYSQCSEKVLNISAGSKMISQNVQNLVTSIQFHDITRQQMEHVKEVFADQISMMEDFHNGTSTMDDNSIMETVTCACELQSAQLNSATDQFYSAVSEILSNLKDIEVNIERIFSESCVLLSEKDTTQKKSLKNIQHELSIISENLRENKEIGNNLTNSIISVVTIVGELSKSIEEIESVGDEIEIIALNSRVKAARSGSNGSALGVLSEAIQKLSIDSKNQSVATTGLLKDISLSSEKLRASIQSFAEAERKKQISEIDNKISRLISSTITIEEEASHLVEKLQSIVSQLKSEINSAVESLNIHEFVKDTSNGIIENLNLITSDYSGDSNSLVSRKEKTKQFLNRYTMHSERNIHQSYTTSGDINNKTGGNSAGFEDNIELF
jgi:methyl-accepting chemotaxis protein